MIEIIEANTDHLIGKARALFQEYAESLGFDLCFQNFDQEMDDFPGQYSAPAGRLYLSRYGNELIGCVGLRCFAKGICEMKRLYVKPNFRGMRAGRALAEASIRAAKDIGYKYMRLDTLPSMESAHKLYRSLGFRQIEPYRQNPIAGAIYMELRLKG
jgi:ribosomal protein S18 acetylase RimI-like enzyme